MSEYLAIDFDQHRLAGVRARVSNQRVRVEQCFQLQWPAETDHWADPAAAGAWLGGELRRLGVTAGEVFISLPRDEVVVRQIEVPDVPDEDLPNLVRLQAETKSASSLSTMVLDFLPLPRSTQTTVRAVLMITIAQQRLDRLAELTAAAGLQLAGVGISTVATSELVARAEARLGAAGDDAALVVSQARQRVEIALVRNGHLLFTHSAQLGGADAAADNAATLAEVRRSLGALSRLDAELRVSRAWVVGTDAQTAALRRAMEEYLDCTVRCLEPLADAAIGCRASERPSEQAQLAGPLGMLLAVAKPTVETVDLLQPRRPLVRPDRRRLKLGLAVGAVAAVVALAFGNTIWQTGKIDQQIQRAQDSLTRANVAIERNESKLSTAGLIDDWDDHDVDFLYQLTQLNRILPGTDRVYLKTLRFNPLSGQAIAQIQADGRARTREDVQQLYQRLAAGKYRVKTHEITKSKDEDEGADKEYPIEFVLDVGITAATDSHVEMPATLEDDDEEDTPASTTPTAADDGVATATVDDTAAKDNDGSEAADEGVEEAADDDSVEVTTDDDSAQVTTDDDSAQVTTDDDSAQVTTDDDAAAKAGDQ